MPVGFTLSELLRLQQERSQVEYNLLPQRPSAPTFIKATGLKLGFRIEWSQAEGADGYRVAMMTTNNLAAPDKLSPLIDGDTTLEYPWFVGDVAITRQFTVQAYKRSVTGEILFSEFTRPFASATSKADGGAADGAPAASPSAPVVPSGSGSTGDPGGVLPPGGRGPNPL